MISIVIPVLNEEKFLPDCLRSLKNQDYTGEYEIVVVDNGSTDNSVSIARESGAGVVFSQTKRDIASARDAGARAASGDIVVQADADTVYPRDWLSRIASYFATHPEAVALAGTFRYRPPQPFWANVESSFRRIANGVATRIFGKPCVISGANFAFRKKAFLQVNGYDKKSYSPDQWGIAARLSKTGKVLYDKSLAVVTSSRRVQKPLFLIILNILTNFCHLLAHIFQACGPAIAREMARPRVARKYARLLPAVLAVAFLAYGYLIPTSTVFGKVYYKGNPSEKLIALTFDDGPNEPYTSQILDTLNAYGIKATFFVTGANTELYPETARRAVAEGHVLGNHSYSHDPNHAVTQKGAQDIALAQEAIFQVVGVKPHLYRPPHGKKSPWELAFLKKENILEVTWSATTNELRAKSAEAIAEQIIRRAKPGRIILLHDGYGNDHEGWKADRTLTVKALPIIIRTLQDEGYSFVTVSDLLDLPAYH